MAKVTFPPASEAVTDDTGGFARSWRLFLEGMWRRSGATQDITMTAASNTSLTFSYRGSDGVLRSGSITLS